jgi:hypothetical protein
MKVKTREVRKPLIKRLPLDGVDHGALTIEETKDTLCRELLLALDESKWDLDYILRCQRAYILYKKVTLQND